MKILFFAQVRVFAGRGEIELSVTEPIEAEDLWRRLEERYPRISQFRHSTRLAKNCEYARTDQTFGNDDEVALLTPVSGG